MKELFVAPDDKNVLNLLKKIKRFNEISEKDLPLFIKAGKFREYEPKETIIKEGNIDSWVYFLLSGTLKIQKNGRDIDTLKRLGDVFGEMDAFGGTSKSSSVIADSKSAILAIDTSVVNKQLQGDQTYFYNMIYKIFAEVLAERLRLQIQENVKLDRELTKKRSPKITKKSISREIEQDLRDKKILLVDPVGSTRKMLRSIFRKELKCNKIVEVINGENALGLLEEEKFDLIVSELELPQMSGFDLLNNIKRMVSVKDTPFIIYCSEWKSSIDKIKQAADEDITHYKSTQCILKPFNANTVVEKVKKTFLKAYKRQKDQKK